MIDKDPVVSIVLVSSGDEASLQRALRSVLAQTFADFECLVLFPTSQQCIAKRVDSLADPRVRTLQCDDNDLPWEGLQRASESCRGEWIAWMYEQDEWLIGRLQQQLALLDSREGYVPKLLGGGVIELSDRLPTYHRWNSIQASKTTKQADATGQALQVCAAWLLNSAFLLNHLATSGRLSAELLVSLFANAQSRHGVDEPILLRHQSLPLSGSSNTRIYDTPLISVVLPTYNRSHMLGRSLCSVLAQTYQQLELLVVDDCSNEDIKAVLESFEDPRIRYIRRESNGGPSAARNTGIQAAKGEFLAFQDSDDVWALDKLEHQVAALQKSPRAAGCIGSMLRVIDDKLFIMRQSNDPLTGLLPASQLVSKPVAYTQTWLLRREPILKAGGFDESLRIWEDWDLLLTLSEQGAFVATPDAIAVSQRFEDSVTQEKNAFVQSIERLLEKHAGLLTGMPVTRAQLYYELAHRLYSVQNYRASRQYFSQAALTRRSHIKAWIYWGLSLMGLQRLISLLQGSLRRLTGREGIR